MKRTLALILTVFSLLPLLLSSCTPSPKLIQTQAGEPIYKKLYNYDSKLNLNVGYYSLDIEALFFSEDPERRIFEVEFTVKITDYEETAKEKLFPESFFSQAYFLNSESEEIKIMGTPIENSKTEQKDTVKIRYAFDMGESPAEGNYDLNVLFTDNTSEPSLSFPYAVIVRDKIEILNEVFYPISDEALVKKVGSDKSSQFKLRNVLYQAESDSFIIMYNRYLGDYDTDNYYSITINAKEKTTSHEDLCELTNLTKLFENITDEDIKSAELALLEQVNNYRTKEGQTIYTLHELKRLILLYPYTKDYACLSVEFIVPAKEGDDAPCDDHWHVMFDEQIYPR